MIWMVHKPRERQREFAFLHRRFNYREVDIALDTFCEALWMGVPVVTLAGQTHAGRVGVSLLTAPGLQDLIAPTPDEYLALAVTLAQDSARLTALRTTLRERMVHSTLCNGPSFASEIERVYRTVWRDWCATAPGKTPH